MTDKIVIIPQDTYGLVVNISEANYIEEITKLDIPYDSICKVVNNNQIVTLDKKNSQLLIHNFNGKLEHTINVDLDVSYTMNTRGSVVYVGGASEKKEKCFLVDISNKKLHIQAIKIPEVMAYGKAIDDIVFLDNKMYLVDNIVEPKYTFEYDISKPTSPVLIRTIHLDYHETYGNIEKAQVNKKWMVYLSTSISGYSGRSSQISVIDTADLEADRKFYFKTYNLEKFDGDSYYKDIFLVDDMLYVLTLFGLGYFNLTSDELNTEDIVFIQHNIVTDRIVPIDDKSLILLNKHTFAFLDLENYDTISTDAIKRRRDRYILELEHKRKYEKEQYQLKESEKNMSFLERIKNWLR